MDRRIVRICRAGDQLPARVSDHEEVRETSQRLTLENVQADTPQAIDVGVVNLGEEADLGWRHGIIVGQEELQPEHSAYAG